MPFSTSPRAIAALFCSLLLLCACGSREEPAPQPISLDQAAQTYLKLVLSIGEHDEDFIVSYYGREELRNEARANPISVKEIGAQAREAAAAIGAVPAEEAVELKRRRNFLLAQLRSVAVRAEMLTGQHVAFDNEAKLVFDMTMPDMDARKYITDVHARIDRIMPGQGQLAQRIEAFRSNFIIPADRLEAVVGAAVQECRRRTLAVLSLPDESLKVDYATGVTWVTHNEYVGNGFSSIKINTDLPVYIERAVEMGCHEGYPGHHVSNVLKDTLLVKGKGWQEFTVQTLFSPQSLTEEGIANFSTELLFPGEARVNFERDTLFGLAGFDRAQAHRYQELLALIEELRYADIEGARRYLDGEWDADYTTRWLVNYRLLSPERARQRLQVFETYRTFIAAAFVGKKMVRDFIEKNATTGDAGSSWQLIRELLVSPTIPEDLRN